MAMNGEMEIETQISRNYVRLWRARRKSFRKSEMKARAEPAASFWCLLVPDSNSH